MPSYLRVILSIVALAAASSGLLWWYQGRPPEVVVVAVDRGPAVDAIYATGTVEPLRWAKIIVPGCSVKPSPLPMVCPL